MRARVPIAVVVFAAVTPRSAARAGAIDVPLPYIGRVLARAASIQAPLLFLQPAGEAPCRL